MVRSKRRQARQPNGSAAPGRPLVPLLAVCTGYFMVILDVTIINVAVPVIGRELSTSLTGIQWISQHGHRRVRVSDCRRHRARVPA
jgi:DHA2 family methylenomycin A resistance protein-like MFS transporter